LDKAGNDSVIACGLVGRKHSQRDGSFLGREDIKYMLEFPTVKIFLIDLAAVRAV
jgi:hypothetical protein